MLIGATGRGDDWSELRDHLVGLGWRVDPFDPVPRGGGIGPEASLPSVHGVDHVILVVSAGGPGDDLPAGRLLHAVGVLQGQLGFGRVVALVDDELDSFLGGTGVVEVRYEEGNLGARFSQVAALLGEPSKPDSQPGAMRWLAQLGVADPSLAPEWWLGAGVLLVVVTVVVVSLVQVFGSPGVATSGASTAGPLMPVVAGAVASQTGQEVGGSVAGLPARCVIDTRPGELIPAQIPCQGIGGLAVDGFGGPWHNEISLISMDKGVVGEVVLARAGAAPTGAVVPLAPEAEQSIEGFGSEEGVNEILLHFSAHGQRVRLHQRPDRGGNEMTVTFSLDL